MKTEDQKSYASASRSAIVARIIIELHMARLIQGVTITDLARKAGIPRQSLSMWEAGTSQPHLAPLEAWAKALGYTLKIDIS